MGDDLFKKITSISNIGVYPSFRWRDCARDHGNNELEFDKTNLIYGRNYSGKTTLSRIVRSLETGVLPDKYEQAQFTVEFIDGATATQSSLLSHGHEVRVFNEDFVREHLGFVIDSESDILSFAVVGKTNVDVEGRIEQKEVELGSGGEDGCGLARELEVKRAAHADARRIHRDATAALQSKLTTKATDRKHGIKYNSVWGDPAYDRLKLERDIKEVADSDYAAISEDEALALEELLAERAKPVVPVPPEPDLLADELAETVRELLERKISITEPIKDLLEDAALAEWVRAGRAHHEGRRSTCGFCGGRLPDGLWNRLDKHFNQESEALRSELESCRSSINQHADSVVKMVRLDGSTLYSEFAGRVAEIQAELDKAVAAYGDGLTELVVQVDRRLADIPSPGEFELPKFASADVKHQAALYGNLVGQSNQMTESLASKQSDAKRTLRLRAVGEFVRDIDYPAELERLAGLQSAVDTASQALEECEGRVASLESEIESLRGQLTDESGAAELANSLLRDYFGHDGFAFQAVGGEDGVRFQVVREGERAHHLSEGERTLLAFCYFVAKLEDVATAGTKPIVWIDDPVSSLDGNHVFYLFSLLRTRLVPGESVEQLIVSTHSLSFLKYLMELSGKHTGHFLLERGRTESRIVEMPKYLRNYVTEFNYLFRQVYRCANTEIEDVDAWDNIVYSFGNDARKFLEIYVYYRFPDGVQQSNCFYDKLVRFFGDDEVAATAARRLAHEYSHAGGSFERVSLPMDVPEMRKIASLILARIEAADRDQYSALLESIGERSAEGTSGSAT